MPVRSPRSNKNRAASRERRRQQRGFWVHVVLGTGIALLLIAANLLFTPQRLWSVLLLVGWGVALLMHGLHVFGVLPWLSADWEKSVLESLSKTLARASKTPRAPESPMAQLTNQIPEAQIIQSAPPRAPSAPLPLPPVFSRPPPASPAAAAPAQPTPAPDAHTAAQGWASLADWPAPSEPPTKPQDRADAAQNNSGWPEGWQPR